MPRIMSGLVMQLMKVVIVDGGVLHRSRGDSKLPTTRLKQNFFFFFFFFFFVGVVTRYTARA